MKAIKLIVIASAAVIMLISCAHQAPAVDVDAEVEAISARVDEAYQNGDEAAVMDILKEEYGKHAKDSVGLIVFTSMMYELTPEEFDDYLAKASDLVREDDHVKAYAAALAQVKKTAAGSKFVDFEGKTPAGDPVRLSDYVGKGKVVLADFWASWCGPCMRAIPHVKEALETYGPKGLEVIGVAVWDGDNSASRQRMEEKGMTWPQIFCGDDKTPTDSYGILGIPTMILFAPDGTIYKREGLRGEATYKSVAEALGK